MNEKELCAFLEKAAYNKPQEVPVEILRNDKYHYRVYFRFMVLLYAVYKAGIYGKEELAVIKAAFIKDWQVFKVTSESNLKSCREIKLLETALHQCRKNAENCADCKNISSVFGHTSTENESDIMPEVNINEQ